MADAPDPTAVKLREEMEQTRTNLSEKLGTLEEKVVTTVEGATTAVADTVATVTDAVQGTVESVKKGVGGAVETVKETFNIPRQVERRPWAMFAGSVAVGFAAGKLLDLLPLGGEAVARGMSAASATARPAYTPSSAARSWSAPSEDGGKGWLQWFQEAFGPEIDKVKGLAVGTALGLVRDLVAQAVPETLGPQIKEVIDSFTTKLGGKPVEGPVLPERQTSGPTHGPAGADL
jgi:hypothetical protein